MAGAGIRFSPTAEIDGRKGTLQQVPSARGRGFVRSIPGLLFLLLAAGAALIPFLWMISTAFKRPEVIYQIPPVWIPVEPTLRHFQNLFGQLSFARNLFNSTVVTFGITALSLLLNSMAGYAFAKHRFPGMERLFGVFLITLMVPAQVTAIPVFLLLKKLGLLNTLAGLIIPAASSVFGIFLMRQFMTSIPDALIESGRVDGCREWGIFWSIVLPQCRPALAALGIFTFLAAWSDFFFPLIVLFDQRKYTLPVALATLNGQHTTDWGMLMAGSLVVITPIVLLFIALQRKFVEGIALTGLKG